MKSIKNMLKSLFNTGFCVIIGLILVGGCNTTVSETTYPLPKPADWSRAEYWYQDSSPVDENKVDVFYVTSTDVVSSTNADGTKSPLALLTAAECKAMKEEMRWFRQNIYTAEFNYFAPFYHQVTFEALGNPRGGRCALWDEAAQEVCEAFDYYITHKNRNRRFILVGFSQGASILRAILKHITDEQYARCVAAYAIGFQVTAEDLASPHIRAATNATDQGVIVSFNSVMYPAGEWKLLSGDAACSINPVNWRTDSTPAKFDYDGQSLTATLNPTNHLLVVDGFTPKKTAFSDYFPAGNLHVYDRTLYIKFLKENAILRAYRQEIER